jgi:hypothetical protein
MGSSLPAERAAQKRSEVWNFEGKLLKLVYVVLRGIARS